jgi:hypothetical protein
VLFGAIVVIAGACNDGDAMKKKMKLKIVRGRKRQKRGAVECTGQKYVQWCNDRSRSDKFELRNPAPEEGFCGIQMM